MADEAETKSTGVLIETTYTAHNPHLTQEATRAIVNGEEMLATVETYEVELVADDLSNSGIKLRFCGSEIADAQRLFVADAKISARFTSANGAPGAEQK